MNQELDHLSHQEKDFAELQKKQELLKKQIRELEASLAKDQERDMFKKLWAMQSNCPLIIIYNNLKLSPGQFLMTMCPLAKKSSSLVPKEIGPFLVEKLK